jgi:hypothetical protein
MYSLKDVYGDNFQQKDKERAVENTLNTLSNNIAHRNYDFMINTDLIWTKENHISNDYIMDMYNKIQSVNNHLNIVHILDKNLLHTLVNVKSVDYFLVVDTQYKTSFLIYITREDVGIL